MKRVGKAFLALAGLVAMTGAAFAEDAPYITYNIKLEPAQVQSEVSPAAENPVSKDNVAFRIANNMGKAVYFVNGSEKTYIPVISQTTVTVPYSTQAYSVQDEQGNTIATWQVAEEKIGKPNVSEATSAQFSQWKSQLQEVVESAQNRTVSYTYKPEPHYYNTSSTTTRGTTVRGYW